MHALQHAVVQAARAGGPCGEGQAAGNTVVTEAREIPRKADPALVPSSITRARTAATARSTEKSQAAHTEQETRSAEPVDYWHHREPFTAAQHAQQASSGGPVAHAAQQQNKKTEEMKP